MHEKKSVNILLEVLLWLFSLVIIYPLGMVLMTSFKAYGESNIAVHQAAHCVDVFQLLPRFGKKERYSSHYSTAPILPCSRSS